MKKAAIVLGKDIKYSGYKYSIKTMDEKYENKFKIQLKIFS
jgi:hypothetical protein